MNKKTRLALMAAAALLGATTSAIAAAPVGLAGVFSGQYAYTNGPGTRVNTWSAGGQAAFGIAPEFGAEIDGGYSRLDGGSGLPSADLWNIGGHLFWAPIMGRLGATLNHQSISGAGSSINFTQYGGFGEYYASDTLTLGLNGGGVSVGNCPGCSDGGYVGGGGIVYAMPNLAITPTVSYLDVTGGKFTTIGLMGEWMFTPDMPLSAYAGYNYIDRSGGGNFDQFLVGIRFYTSGNGNSLIEKHRNGALTDLNRTGLAFKF